MTAAKSAVEHCLSDDAAARTSTALIITGTEAYCGTSTHGIQQVQQ